MLEDNLSQLCIRRKYPGSAVSKNMKTLTNEPQNSRNKAVIRQYFLPSSESQGGPAVDG